MAARLGYVNDNGETFLYQDGLAVMNASYVLAEDQYTWQHPGSKQYHYIDYLLMRQNERFWCVSDQFFGLLDRP